MTWRGRFIHDKQTPAKQPSFAGVLYLNGNGNFKKDR